VAINVAIKETLLAVRRVPVTVGFVALLAAAEIGYALLARPDATRLAAWASTNVDRLRTEPIGPMVVSAFVVEDHPFAWLVIAAVAFALVEWRVGWWRALAPAVAAHVVGTLVSEGIVWWRVDDHALPTSELYQLDIGASYVVVGVLAVAVVVAPRAGQIVAAGLLVALSPSLLDGTSTLAVPAVGHLTAAAVGFASGAVLRRNARIAGYWPARRPM
jgi:hypothetical protein